jgi:hypothetical protein
MFHVDKYARSHESKAPEKYSVAELTGAKKVQNYYVWPFKCPVIGCGDTVPSDYKPEGRYRFKMDVDYTPGMLVNDIGTLVEDHGLDLVVRAINNGISLELNDSVKPTPKKSLSEAEKIGWLSVNRPDEARELIGQPSAVWVKAYDAIM